MGAGRPYGRTKCTWWNYISKWITVTSLSTAGKYNSTKEDAKTADKWWSYFILTLRLPDWTHLDQQVSKQDQIRTRTGIQKKTG